jgi:hypothetical protein
VRRNINSPRAFSESPIAGVQFAGQQPHSHIRSNWSDMRLA